jgi:hypothetical protein
MTAKPSPQHQLKPAIKNGGKHPRVKFSKTNRVISLVNRVQRDLSQDQQSDADSDVSSDSSMSVDHRPKSLVWKGNSPGRNASHIRSVSHIRRTEKVIIAPAQDAKQPAQPSADDDSSDSEPPPLCEDDSESDDDDAQPKGQPVRQLQRKSTPHHNHSDSDSDSDSNRAPAKGPKTAATVQEGTQPVDADAKTVAVDRRAPINPATGLSADDFMFEINIDRQSSLNVYLDYRRNGGKMKFFPEDDGTEYYYSTQ